MIHSDFITKQQINHFIHRKEFDGRHEKRTKFLASTIDKSYRFGLSASLVDGMGLLENYFWTDSGRLTHPLD